MRYFLVFICLLLTPVFAEQETFISDHETESFMNEVGKKIAEVAGTATPPRIQLVQSSEVNAGATFGGVIVFLTGLIVKCENVGQLIGVEAHEIAHFAATHLVQQTVAAEQATGPAIAAAMIGGALSLAGGGPAPLLAGVAGGAHVFERSMLAGYRNCEEAADAGALRYLDLLGWPSDGLYQFLSMLNKTFSGKVDPFTVTHPLTDVRLEKVKLYQSTNSGPKKFPDGYEERFQRIRAKIIAFTQEPNSVLRRYTATETTIPALYARAIAFYRLKRIDKALEIVQTLLERMPRDPYFLELKGQILFENGKLSAALPVFREAHAVLPDAEPIAIFLAQVLFELSKNFGSNLDESIKILEGVVEKNKQNIFAWRLLAGGYGQKQENDRASLCLAEEAWLTGDHNRAKKYAEKLKNSSIERVRLRARDMAQALAALPT